MKTTETLSVAIPTYNRGDMIKKTLESIAIQKHPVNEVIIVDDGSTDNTEEIVNKFNHTGIPIVYRKINNQGPAIARREAIKLCRMNWIALCDSDDLWNDNHIETFIKCITLFPNINVYFANFSIYKSQDPDKFSTSPNGWWKQVIHKTQNSLFTLKKNSYNSFLSFQPVFPSTLIFKQSIYNKIGGIAKDLGRLNSEDAHLTRRLIAYGITGGTKKPTVQIRKHEENYSIDTLKNLSGRLIILERLCNFNEIPEEFISTTQKEIINSRIELFNQYYWDKQYSNAIKIFKKIRVINLSPKIIVKFFIILILKYTHE